MPTSRYLRAGLLLMMLAGGQSAGWAAPSPPAVAGDMQQASINGVQVAYTDEGAGLPVVFVHGFPFNHTIWEHQRQVLRRTHRVITVDLPGFGASTAHDGPGDIRTYADDLATLLQTLRTGPVVMVGHSMGGYTTLGFARWHRPLLKGLVLVASEPDLDSPEVMATYAPSLAAVRRHGVTAIVDELAPLMLGPDQAALQPQVRAIMATASVPGTIASLEAMRDRRDSTDLLQTLNLPTLLVAGTADQVILPAKSDRMAQQIPGAQLIRLPGIGHLPTLEAPDSVTAKLQQFLSSL